MFALAEDLALRLRREARERQGPFYAYQRERIRARCAEFAQIPWDRTSVHFATMANASRPFLAEVRASGLNVFVNSLGHLEIAQSLGWSGEQIVYTASAMDEPTMRCVQRSGALLNLDSRGQLELFWRLFPDAPVGIRCNIGDRVLPRRSRGGYFLGRESRLGLSLPEIEALSGNGRIRGLHLYVGTDLTDLDYFRDCYQQLAQLADLFPGLEYLDFGGGFGLPNGSGPFDLRRYGELVAQSMAEVSGRLGRPLRLILEPGRLLAGESGYFVCRVTDVKVREDLQLLGTNASSAQFPRPLFYPEEAHHPVCLLSEETRGEPTRTAVYGCSTYSRDFLARDVRLPPAAQDDLLVFGDAGAYCASAHTAFLGFPAADEVYL